MQDALCKNSAPNRRKNPEAKDIFFPDKGESYNEAVMMCIECPVRIQCKEYRDKTGSTHGMWGAERGKTDE